MIKDKDIALQIKNDFDYIYRVKPNYVSCAVMHEMNYEYVLYVFVKEGTKGQSPYPETFLGMAIKEYEQPKAL